MSVRGLRFPLLAAALCVAAGAARAGSLTLDIERLDSPALQLEGVKLALTSLHSGPARLAIARARMGEREWRNAALDCPQLTLDARALRCERGVLRLPAAAGKKVADIGVAFTYRTDTRAFSATLAPGGEERWQIDHAPARGVSTTRARLEHVDLARAAALLPQAQPYAPAGRVDGEVTLRLTGKRKELSANLALSEGRFADKAGTHAGEKLGAILALTAQGQGEAWAWQGKLDWQKGEAYLAPLYVATPGITLEVAGSVAARRVEVSAGKLQWLGMGDVAFSGAGQMPAQGAPSSGFVLEQFDFSSGDLALTALGSTLIAPILDARAGPRLAWQGRARASGSVRNGELTAGELTLTDAAVSEAQGRYSLQGVRASIPWRADESTDAQIDIAQAHWGKLPVGPVSLPVKLRGTAARLFHTEFPLLDGTVVLDDVRYTHGHERTSWRAQVALTPVSMERLSEAMGWPRMHGVVSASIPGIRQEGSTIALDGALVVQVFDGFASVTDLKLIEPFGRTPRLYADAELRHLDLDMLTRTFSFGSVTGYIDGDLKGLELAGVTPLRVDARIESSPGDYRRRISQRAVQNISALGGAGAAAAIQRSVLRLFDEFSYSKLGLTCKLRDGVCEMGGVEEAPSGYVMVKGGGIPAINVIGYNRRVDWDELVARIKRVTESNAKPVVR